MKVTAIVIVRYELRHTLAMLRIRLFRSPKKILHKCNMTTISCMVYFPQEFKKATQDTFHLTLGVRYHRDRWAEATPDPADVEAPHRQCRFQAYRQFVLWQ